MKHSIYRRIRLEINKCVFNLACLLLFNYAIFRRGARVSGIDVSSINIASIRVIAPIFLSTFQLAQYGPNLHLLFFYIVNIDRDRLFNQAHRIKIP